MSASVGDFSAPIEGSSWIAHEDLILFCDAQVAFASTTPVGTRFPLYFPYDVYILVFSFLVPNV